MADERIDKVVAVRLGAEYSRTYAKQMIDKGLVTVNDSKVKPRYSVSSGDRVVMELSPAEDHYAEPEEISLEVLYEDASFIVLNKPAGMVVHPGSGNKKGTLVNALLFHCGKMANTGDETRPGIVHRLDKDTSGVIVAAKTERALRSISKQFLARTVKKTYIALVKGKVELDNGIVDVPLARSVMDRKKMDIDMVSGKEACTVYHVIKRYEKFTVLRLEPKTGRTHQLRVHMKHIGHPLLGDAKYGYPQGMPRQALHAESLRFSHPDTGKAMEFTAPVPEDMKKVVRDEEERIKG
ncbi:MAG: RluA family pseudouridine synthase [Candidatus Omnitrophica bacterium]|nr:RluA family pseudouridine synthase [Candidatus Omnitrophota bacterium]